MFCTSSPKTLRNYTIIKIMPHPKTVQGNMMPATLLASGLVGFLTIASLLVLPFGTGVVAQMRLSPETKTIIEGEHFVVEVIVDSTVPVNVFAGELTFNSQTLQVASIDYNTSIADLWAEEPWYSNGEGTLTFAGGTTKRGGFIGEDTLITITFRAHNQGAGSLAIKNAHILQHDGLGTEAQLAAPIDALFTVKTLEEIEKVNLVQQSIAPSSYAVVRTPPTTDLNGDGKQSIADISIFMLNLGSQDARFDFNLDGTVNLKDFNILLSAR